MILENQEDSNTTSNTQNVLGGILIGALVGAATMLLLAPQSGKDTRTQIQNKAVELRDRTTEIMEDTLTQARTNANKLTADLKERVQALAVEQLDNVSEAAQASKKGIQSS